MGWSWLRAREWERHFELQAHGKVSWLGGMNDQKDHLEQRERAKSIAWRYSIIEGMIRQSCDLPIKQGGKKVVPQTSENKELMKKSKKK